MSEEVCTYLVVGGGIAGVSCVQQLAFEEPDVPVVLVSAEGTVRQASALQVTRLAHQVHVTDISGHQLTELCPNVTLRRGVVTRLDGKHKTVQLSDGGRLRYGRLCICTGARPRLPLPPNPALITIRDGHSVDELRRKLRAARRILVIGNGGIASELVFVLRDVEVVWAVRDSSISSTFVDPGAAEFLLPQLGKDASPDTETSGPAPRRWRYDAAAMEGGGDSGVAGSALGPDWLQRLEARGAGTRRVRVLYRTELRRLRTPTEVARDGGTADAPSPAQPATDGTDDRWPVHAELTCGELVRCDFVVAATGVLPNTEPFTQDTALRLADDGGILVDDHMRTHESDVYAAGDVCSPDWELAPHWFQMRLWSQARQMGMYAARCMSADSLGQPLLQDFCFEMFGHVTRLLGHKLVLLGLYNGQKLGTDYTALVRMTPGKEFIKLVLREGRVQGALLLGETELEETFENLILSQVDVSHLGDDLLAPDVDIDDYFD